MTKSGTSASFTYNEDGLRVQKNVNGTVTNYVLHGKNVVHLTQGSNNLHFFYGADGSPAIVEYNGVSYGYVKSLQGDIIAIVNASGTSVVQYAYDAWGRPINKTGNMASTLGTLNPFRYRGYVYDEETGLYYLRSRYYNFTWCRFVNTDKYLPTSLLSKNAFAYCTNNSPNKQDPNGTIGLIATIGICISVAVAMEHKLIVSAAADKFLSDKGWSVTNILFQHGLWQSGYKFTDQTNDMELLNSVNYVKAQIASDPQTYEMVRPYAEQMLPGTTLNIPTTIFEYTEGDMYYSFQHLSYEATITKQQNGSWSASIHMTDIYNFDSIRNPFTLGGAANDGGLILQLFGSLDAYDIDLTVMLYSK